MLQVYVKAVWMGREEESALIEMYFVYSKHSVNRLDIKNRHIMKIGGVGGNSCAAGALWALG